MAINYNTALPVSNLQLYLDASNRKSYPGTGSIWYDLSGNNKTFTWVAAPSFTSSTTKSYFSTSGNLCQGPASNSFNINNGTGYTIIMISTTDSDNANSAFKFYNTNGRNSSSTSRGIFLHPGWSNYTMYFDQSTCCAADQRTNVTFTLADMRNFRVWAFRSRLYDRSIFMNGVSQGTNSTYAGNINLGSAGVDLGGSDEYGNTASNWVGKLALFAVYNTGLSDSTILNISNGLRTRFGI